MVLAAFWAGAAVAGVEQAVAVPSRNAVTLAEVVTDVPGNGLTYRFRFIAPHIAGSPDFDATSADMQHLCDSYALPRLGGIGPVPAQIVISLADRAVAFGEISPDAVQFFEAYRPEDGRCVWENF